jgi:hypothetical protein
MTWERAIENARARFANNGEFLLLPDESINEVVRREKVPNAPGIYIVFGRDDLERPLYIGKSGTMITDGSMKKQSLGKRLVRKQGGMSRSKFFRKLMADSGLAGLTFVWFVTHDKNIKIIPALAEMELAQAHYEKYGCLPEFNKCF